MTELVLVDLMMPMISNIDVLNYGTTVFALVAGLGIGLGFYESVQDSLGIMIVVLLMTQFMELNNVYWLTIVLAFIYGILVIYKKEEAT